MLQTKQLNPPGAQLNGLSQQCTTGLDTLVKKLQSQLGEDRSVELGDWSDWRPG